MSSLRHSLAQRWPVRNSDVTSILLTDQRANKQARKTCGSKWKLGRTAPKNGWMMECKVSRRYGNARMAVDKFLTITRNANISACRDAPLNGSCARCQHTYRTDWCRMPVSSRWPHWLWRFGLRRRNGPPPLGYRSFPGNSRFFVCSARRAMSIACLSREPFTKGCGSNSVIAISASR